MPGLYDLSSNANVSVSNTTGLYQVSSNVSVLNSAQTLLNLLSNTGNVSFGLTTLGTQVQAWAEVDVSAATVQLVGDVFGSGITGAPITTTLSVTGVTSGTYGSAAVIPVVTVDATGRITTITTVANPANYGNANVAAYLPTDSTILSLQANAASQETEIVVLQGNAAGQAIAINNINSALNTLNANVGSFEVTTNANLGTATNNITTLFSNAATQATAINTINANLGTVFTHVNTLDANVGAFETYANAHFATSSYGNANVAAYLPTYTGNLNGTLTSGNVVADSINITVTSNLSTDHIALQANYGNINLGGQYVVSDFLTVDNVLDVVTVVGNINTAYNPGFMHGGFITATNNISATQNITAGGNVQATYFLGDGSKLSNISSSFGNTQVNAYLQSGQITSIIGQGYPAGIDLNDTNAASITGGNSAQVYGGSQVIITTSLTTPGTSILAQAANVIIEGDNGAVKTANLLIPNGYLTVNGRMTTSGGVFWANGTAYSTGGSSSTAFSGNLAGNVLYDSVNQRIFANAYPLSPMSPTIGATYYNYIQNAPVYTSGNLSAPGAPNGNQQQSGVTTGLIVTSNVAATSSGQSTNNRTTVATVLASGVQLQPGTWNNQDRFRSSVIGLDVNLNNQSIGSMSTSSVSAASVAGVNAYGLVSGTGSVGGVVGAINQAIVAPSAGAGISANVQYASGVFSYVSLQNTAGSQYKGNVVVGRGLVPLATGMSANLVIQNMIGLHTYSGWAGSGATSATTAQNRLALLNEDAYTNIATAGNVFIGVGSPAAYGVTNNNTLNTSAGLTVGSGGINSYGNVTIWGYAQLLPGPGGVNSLGPVTATTYYGDGSTLSNIATSTQLQTLSANVGAFETYANLTFGSSSYGNTQVSTYLPHATGYSDAWLMPTGGNTARPSFAANGHIRFNTDYQNPEWFNGATSTWYPFSANVTAAPPAPSSYSVGYLVVAGGGSGGSQGGGGGGAGGLLTGTATFNASTVYTVTVGAGGAASVGTYLIGNNGTNSVLSGTGLTTQTAVGGGGGGAFTTQNPTAGGSGGGAFGGGPGTTNYGAAGTSGQGNAGGNINPGPPYGGSGAGGGGAGGIGGSGNENQGGGGGVGSASSITGSSTYYAGGGGGGTDGGATNSGGLGGGGNGQPYTDSSANGVAGTANTGGGGGGTRNGSGSGSCASGAGGSGVVILSIPTTNYSGTTTGSPSVSTSGSNTILTFTASGSYTA